MDKNLLPILSGFFVIDDDGPLAIGKYAVALPVLAADGDDL
jgi:hypothetical protein